MFTASQIASFDFSLLCLCLYVFGCLAPKKKSHSTTRQENIAQDFKYCLLVYIISEAYGYSQIYQIVDRISPNLTYFIYSFLYLVVIAKLTSLRIMLISFMLAIFQIVNFLQAELYAISLEGAWSARFILYEINCVLYSAYEIVVTILHLFVIISTVDRDRLVKSTRLFFGNFLFNISANCYNIYSKSPTTSGATAKRGRR